MYDNERGDALAAVERVGIPMAMLVVVLLALNNAEKVSDKDAKLVELTTELNVDLPTDLRVIEQTPDSITVATANGTQTISRVELEQAQAQLVKEHPEYAKFLNSGKIQIFNGTNMTDSVK